MSALMKQAMEILVELDEGEQVLVVDFMKLLAAKTPPTKLSLAEEFALYPEDLTSDTEIDWGKPVGDEIW
ncbi:MAG: hypothetical protein FWB71_05330 [Defluviitaleaceae bacterium]|nr:hypothetical protein [Defluviitaleaceae bacterium]